ncbi:uncharacterized protein LOC123556613 [Mercenaria mercenaria]|uniref:uncharacterized protein LOC123556613 n=1 Tax=Mercenaria mercenaria TaxID=6596 RepID=UPI00234F5D35|nr:uncharacterized protein LOC123556613 [Mercenaria mercenaria]
MRSFNAALICIAITGSVFGSLLVCTLDKYRINITIDCDESNKIHIVDIFKMKLTNISTYCGDMPKRYTVGQKYGVRNQMVHRLLTKCSGQRSCRVPIYTGYDRSQRETISIALKYTCVPAVAFIPFCEEMSTTRYFTFPLFLIHHGLENTIHDTCSCDVKYRGKFRVTLTLFPTEREYLKVKSRTIGTKSKHFKDRVYRNMTISDNPEKETFIVENSKTKNKDEKALILVQLAANDAESSLTLQCFGPIAEIHIHDGFQTTQRSMKTTTSTTSITLYAVIPSVSIICLLGIGLCIFVIHHHHVGRRNQRIGAGPGRTNTDVAAVDTRNLDTTFNNNSIGSCSHSYAEIGSAAFGYLHCVPDDTPEQDLLANMQYDTADEDPDYQAQAQDPSLKVMSERLINMAYQGEVVNDKTRRRVDTFEDR